MNNPEPGIIHAIEKLLTPKPTSQLSKIDPSDTFYDELLQLYCVKFKLTW